MDRYNRYKKEGNEGGARVKGYQKEPLQNLAVWLSTGANPGCRLGLALRLCLTAQAFSFALEWGEGEGQGEPRSYVYERDIARKREHRHSMIANETLASKIFLFFCQRRRLVPSGRIYLVNRAHP